MTSDFYRNGRKSESVFINGYDFATLSPEQAVDAFEEMGILVEPDERERYLKQGDSLSYDSSGELFIFFRRERGKYGVRRNRVAGYKRRDEKAF